jgi:hypothetical protein
MRKKFFVGLFLTAIVSIVAGEYWINRSGAQDAPKKVEPEEKKSDLFDILKKDLDAKKDYSPAFPLPNLPTAPPTVSKEPIVPPPSPVLQDAPKLSDLKTPEPLPVQSPQKVAEPTLPLFPNVVPAAQTVPPPVIVNQQPPLPPTGLSKTPTAEPKPVDPVQPNPKAAINELPPPSKPKAEGLPTFPALPPTQATKPVPTQNVKPAINNDEPSPFIPPPLKKEASEGVPAVQVSPMQPIADQVAKLKNCPWSLQIDMVDGQTVIMATVNKKHEFKIVCQTLDLQTGKGTLKASGKVQISGDALNGSCEHLAIGLHDDRLVLEGTAEVRIQKLTANVSDAKPAAFELKGATLSLRISELEASKLIQADWRGSESKVTLANGSPLAANGTTDKQWSPYGKLRHSDNKSEPTYYLENSAGRRVLQLVTREGGTLDQYVGQTISVFGPTEQLHGSTVVRVTHIALP